MAFVMPQKWSEDEIKVAVETSADRFSEGRRSEGIEYYVTTFDDLEERLRVLFEVTGNLSMLEEKFSSLLADGWLRELRYLTAPVISEDDLKKGLD